eukprot:gene18-3414_t
MSEGPAKNSSAATLPPDLQLHGADGELAANSPVVTARFDNPDIIGVGGGAPLCPCVYVNRLAAIVLRSGDEPELELGDEIIMVNDEVTIGKSCEEVQSLLKTENEMPVSITYRKLPEYLAKTTSKGKYQARLLITHGALQLSPELRASFHADYATFPHEEVIDFEAKMDAVRRSSEFYKGMVTHTQQYIGKLERLSLAADGLATGLIRTSQQEEHDALRHKLDAFVKVLRTESTSTRKAISSVKYVSDHLSTFLASVLSDANSSIENFKRCREDLLAVTMRIFEISQQQYQAREQQRAVPEAETGNYPLRHMLRQKGRYSLEYNRLRDILDGKMQLLVIENEIVHQRWVTYSRSWAARDIATQLGRMVSSLSERASATASAVQEAAEVSRHLKDNSAELCRASNVDKFLQPFEFDPDAHASHEQDVVVASGNEDENTPSPPSS